MKINPINLNYCELQLFPSQPYLENKFGAVRFDDIPQKPGIYRFFDRENTLIYVGKAKNLRKRLFSYKRATPGKTTKKEAALIRKIHRFEYEQLNSEEEAFLAENRWIRDWRPEFNHQNKNIETYYYIILYQTNLGPGLEYSMIPGVPLFNHTCDKKISDNFRAPLFTIETAQIFGCFKGHRSVRTHLGNLLRLIWFSLHETSKPSDLPPLLSRNLTPKRCFFDVKAHQKTLSDTLYSGLIDWFGGHSPDLVYSLIQRLTGKKSRFQQQFLFSITDNLLGYFDRTLVSYRNLISEKKKNGNSEFIYQDELDDLHVLYKGH